MFQITWHVTSRRDLLIQHPFVFSEPPCLSEEHDGAIHVIIFLILCAWTCTGQQHKELTFCLCTVKHFISITEMRDSYQVVPVAEYKILKAKTWGHLRISQQAPLRWSEFELFEVFGFASHDGAAAGPGLVRAMVEGPEHTNRG